MKSAAYLLLLLTLTACGSTHKGQEKQLRQDADSFATAYFNWRFEEALQWCTDSSSLWLEYAASQVHDADVELLRSKEEGATHELGTIDYQDDSTAQTAVSVRNFLLMDTIGKAARPVETADYKLPMKFERGQWRVSLKELPREQKTYN